MIVSFKRTGERRYAVSVAVPGRPLQVMDPAPGYDHDIPHDLVHYVVEAELGLTTGVYGRAAKGGGTFIGAGDTSSSARERARAQRKQRKRESSLRALDDGSAREMETSERLAALCDVAWRRKHGQQPDALRKAPLPLSEQDVERVARVVARLDELAPSWRLLPIGAQLCFEWPSARVV